MKLFQTISLFVLFSFVLISCKSENPVETSDPQFNTPGIYDMDSFQILYITDSGSDGDGTKLFAVSLDDDNSRGNLYLIETLPAENFDKVDAVAATRDGSKIYAIDKYSSHLGEYDITKQQFSDLGTVTGIGDSIVQAAISPEGNLYASSQTDSMIYAINVDQVSAQSMGNIQPSNQSELLSILGADIVFDRDGNLFLWTNLDRPSLYRMDDFESITERPIPGEFVGSSGGESFFTGLAITDNGSGELIGSTHQDNITVVNKTSGQLEFEYPMYFHGDEYDYSWGDMTVGALGQPYITTLNINAGTAAQGEEVGRMIVNSDGEYIYVGFDLSSSFYTVNSVHAWVGTETSNIPAQDLPYQLPFTTDDIDRGTKQYTMQIPIDEITSKIGCGDEVKFIAFAQVEDADGTATASAVGDQTLSQTGIQEWGFVSGFSIYCSPIAFSD